MTLWGFFFFFFLIDYSGVEEETGFCLLILKLARLLSPSLALLVHLNLLHLWGGYLSYAKNVTLLFVPFLPLLIPQRLVLSAGRPRTLPQTDDGALCLLSRS